MNTTDWASRMARMPDEDLIEIASSGEAEAYQEAAIEAAKRELATRSPEAVTAARISADVQAARDLRANRSSAPLSNAGWIAFTLFGVILGPAILAAIALYMRGYVQKAKDAAGAIAASFVFWGLIVAASLFFFG